MSNESAVRQLILALQEIFVENYYTSATASEHQFPTCTDYHPEILIIPSCCAFLRALFFYDYLITIGQEIEVVWRRKLTGATLLYVLNRYLIFIFFPFYLVVMFDESLPCESGFVLTLLTNAFAALALLNTAAFSAVRVYAISNRDWRFSCIVFVLGLIPVATNIYQYSQSKLVASQGICSAIFTISEPLHTKLTIVTRVFAIAVDTFAVCVTLHATYGVKRLAVTAKANVSIVTLLLRDGTIYFSVLLALNVTQMVLFATTSFGDFGLLIDVLTSILLSRFFLNLRQVYLSRGDNDIQLSQMSDLRFASKIVGNMGAPLNHGPSAFDIAETPDVGSSADEVAAGNLPLWDNQDKDEPRDSDVCLVAKEPFTDGFGLPDVDWDVREIVSE